MYKIVIYVILTYIFLLLNTPLFGISQSLFQDDQIVIHNRKGFDPRLDNTPSKTDIDTGPNPGQTLNNHFFPGCIAYRHGYYIRAKNEFSFFIRYPHLTQMNQRHIEFHSFANYALGMIYFYHASGVGRIALAERHFEDSIKWNSKNYLSYLELARLLASIDLKDKAISVLQKLLALQPDAEIALEAKKELSVLQVRKP